MDVVKGALSERQNLREQFVRMSQTLQSYGTLIMLPYWEGGEGRIMFPSARQDGTGEFETNADGEWLKVIQWAIPKVSRGLSE